MDSIVDIWPLTNESVEALYGWPLSVGTVYAGTCYRRDMAVTLEEGGSVCVASVGAAVSAPNAWSVSDGALVLEGRNAELCFDKLITKNGSVSMLGCSPADQLSYFLYPQVSLSDTELRVRFCVPSHVDTLDVSGARIVRRMVKRGVEPSDIVLVVNGAQEDGLETRDDGVCVSRVTHASWEFAGLIDVVESGHDADLWFLLHDTCDIGPNFTRLLGSLDYGLNFDVVFVDGAGAFNMGLYRAEFLKAQHAYLASLKNLSMRKRENVTGYGGSGLASRAVLTAVCNGSLNHGSQLNSKRDVFASGVKRLVNYMPDLDLYKFRRQPSGL